jgi:hypothetical protein
LGLSLCHTEQMRDAAGSEVLRDSVNTSSHPRHILLRVLITEKSVFTRPLRSKKM